MKIKKIDEQIRDILEERIYEDVMSKFYNKIELLKEDILNYTRQMSMIESKKLSIEIKLINSPKKKGGENETKEKRM